MVIVGTALTAVDVAMTLAEDRPDVQICALSRHGARPRAHLTGPARAPRPTDLLPGASLAESTEALKSELAREPDAWRETIDGLRWLTPDLWRA